MARRAAVRPSKRRGAASEIEVRARKVQILVLDVDGVLTDGRFTIDARGRETRTFHAADRAGIALLRRAGIEVLALVARRPRTLPAYARTLQLTTVVSGAGRGLASVTRYCRRRGLDLAAVAYVGHDVLELPLLGAVGLAISPADGRDQTRRATRWVVHRPAGAGVVREIAERILRAQGKWASTIGEIWRQWD
jgi:3-deoxy-D-manno-octulosonate 8-phosphate phosphatase (KDO 8-P phosphatase)